MTLPSFLYFLPSILVGSLLVHLLWPDERPLAALLKFSLGIGMGLGLNSILYFLALLLGAGAVSALIAQIILAVVLSGAIVVLRRGIPLNIKFGRPTRLQTFLLALAALAFLFSVLAFFNTFNARPQGAFDAWSIWNRAARFIYRDPQNWTAALSPDLHWLNHADYPLFVPLNVAWGWNMAGAETQRVPMAQGFLFLIASLAAMFASAGLNRTVGQAALAALALMSSSMPAGVSAALIADAPVTFFILVSSALIYFHFSEGKPSVLALAGFMAGLAAWSKNEGLLYVVVSLPVLPLAAPRKAPRTLLWYGAGLAVPLAVVLYFKSLVPANDLLADGGDALSKLTDLSRCWIVAKAYFRQLFAVGSEGPIGILPALIVYGLFLRADFSSASRTGALAVAAMIALQTLGYVVIYVLTPHDLNWQLDTSLNRLIFHVYPAALFLFFRLVSTPENVFTE